MPFIIKNLNLFDPELQLTNTVPMTKNKLKGLLSTLKKFKVQIILVVEDKKRSDHKILNLSTKLIPNDSEMDEAFKSMHQSIMTKVKNYASEDWMDETVVKHVIYLAVMSEN